MSLKHYKYICKDDISLVENYDLALADNFKGWVLHHRLETKCPIFKPTCQQLIDNGLYYGRPANELIFMRREDHLSLHHKGKTVSNSEEARRKMSEAHKGKRPSNYGKRLSEETRRRMSEAKKDKHWKLVDGKRVWY